MIKIDKKNWIIKVELREVYCNVFQENDNAKRKW